MVDIPSGVFKSYPQIASLVGLATVPDKAVLCIYQYDICFVSKKQRSILTRDWSFLS